MHNKPLCRGILATYPRRLPFGGPDLVRNIIWHGSSAGGRWATGDRPFGVLRSSLAHAYDWTVQPAWRRVPWVTGWRLHPR